MGIYYIVVGSIPVHSVDYTIVRTRAIGELMQNTRVMCAEVRLYHRGSRLSKWFALFFSTSKPVAVSVFIY